MKAKGKGKHSNPQKAAKKARTRKLKYNLSYISLGERQNVLTLRDEGYTIAKIAATMRIGTKSVSRILKQWRETKNFAPKPKKVVPL